MACNFIDSHSLKLAMVFVFTRHGSRTPCHPGYSFNIEFEEDMLRHPDHTFVPIKCNFIKAASTDTAATEESKRFNIKTEVKQKNETLIQQKDESFPLGQLLRKGAEDQYRLGEKLRQRYIKQEALLEKIYKESDILVQSSNKQRTIQSARCLLAGMFPNHNPIKAIPVYVATSAFENIILPFIPYAKLVNQELMQSPEMLPGLEKALKIVQEKINSRVDLNLCNLWDNLNTLKELNLCPPLSPELMTAVSTWGYKWFMRKVLGTSDNRFEVLQAAIGMLVDFMLQKIERMHQNKPTHKFFVFSGHDGTLLCMMYALGFEIDHIPPTSSNLIIEIYQKHTDHQKLFAKIIYNDQVQMLGVCGSLYPINKVTEVLSKYRQTPREFKKAYSKIR